MSDLSGNVRHPREMGATEVTAFLSHLATARNVSASTQNQALSALLFLYRDVLGMTLPWLGDPLTSRLSSPGRRCAPSSRTAPARSG
ncbi:MAG TPA: phage integrase N-terminal SAM-like domain-containing protein [Pyrinomonadaceae bacterium]